MKAPIFFAGMVATSIVIVVFQYFDTQSLFVALGCGILTLLILQISYLAYVALLVRKETKRRRSPSSASSPESAGENPSGAPWSSDPATGAKKPL